MSQQIDRNRLEQEAVKLLQKGKTDRAIEHYQALLRDDPRDRRIRQKLAEVYIQVGRVAEGERHLRELAKSFQKQGNERQAIPLLKTLVKIKPDDAELREQLGDCYIVTGFPDDARKSYDKVLEMLERVYPDKAVPVLQKIIKLSPGEMPLQIKLAELFEAAHWSERACNEWQRLAKEARRLGRSDDRARFLELALRLRPDTVSIMQDAAEARLVVNEPQQALAHLQKAVQANGADPRTLELLGATFQALGELDKARPVWLAAARALGERGRAVPRAEALRKALECGADDPEIRAELGEADREAERYRIKLDEEPWAQPVEEAEAELVIRARVQARYGFPDRARKTLEAAGGAVRRSLAVRIALAEILAGMGEKAAASRELADISPPDAEAGRKLALRRSVLEGVEPVDLAAQAASPADDELVDDEIIDDEAVDDKLVDDADDVFDEDVFDDPDEDLDERTDPGQQDADAWHLDEQTDPGADAIGEGERLVAAGRIDEAIEAYRRALTTRPADQHLLMRIGELMSLRRQASAPPPPTPAAPQPGAVPDFSEVFGGAALEVEDDGERNDPFSFLDEPASPVSGREPARASSGGAAVRSSASSPRMAEARAWLAVFQPERVEALLSGDDSLGAQILRARATRAGGDLSGALALLREAVADAGETDPDYLESLLELAALNAATGKIRAALRLLDEIRDLDPGYQPALVSDVRRGIELLQGH